jgi:hypothetical protein
MYIISMAARLSSDWPRNLAGIPEKVLPMKSYFANSLRPTRAHANPAALLWRKIEILGPASRAIRFRRFATGFGPEGTSR